MRRRVSSSFSARFSVSAAKNPRVPNFRPFEGPHRLNTWGPRGRDEQQRSSRTAPSSPPISPTRPISASRASTIVEIGPNLSGDETLDATGCYIMPGGIDPHTHLEMPFMGTYSADDFESARAPALSGGTTMVVDFCLPSPQPVAARSAQQMWDNKTSKASATTPSTWRSPGGASRCSTRWPMSSIAASPVQALHGLQGRADGE